MQVKKYCLKNKLLQKRLHNYDVFFGFRWSYLLTALNALTFFIYNLIWEKLCSKLV